MAMRFVLVAFYPCEFSNLTTTEFLLSLLYGLRVDTAIIFTFLSLLFLLSTLPFSWVYHKKFRIMIGFIWGAITAVILTINFGDILYFGFVHRHISDELAVIGNDIDILIDMGLNFYLPHTLATLAFIMITIYAFVKIFSTPIKSETTSLKALWISLLIIVIAFIGIRGKIQGISFAVSDAFAVNKLSSGNLALNGFFCIYRSGSKANVNHNHKPFEEALVDVKSMLKSDNIIYHDKAYPLYRSYTAGALPQFKNEKPNVVIILLESISAKYLDGFTHNNFKASHHLDTLGNNGIKFTNFYANGQRSLAGITSVFTGITQPNGFTAFGEGLELSGLSYLGRMAKENGYETLSMQSSNRGSFRVDKLSELAGFEAYYGAEDMPHLGDETSQPYYGVWDGDMLKFLSTKLDTAQEPFISFAFTASTHAPYVSAGKKYELYPHDDNSREGFLNTLNYVDIQINEFMQRASKQTWFDNTIFIFMADHCLGYDAHKEKLDDKLLDQAKDEISILDNYHIPLIMYAPKYFKPQVNNTLGSHADIMPTLAHILGWQNGFTTLSQSLFDSSVTERFVTTRAGSIIGLANEKTAVYYNFKTFLESSGERENEKVLQDKLLSVDTVKASLLNTIRFAKEEGK